MLFKEVYQLKAIDYLATMVGFSLFKHFIAGESNKSEELSYWKRS